MTFVLPDVLLLLEEFARGGGGGSGGGGGGGGGSGGSGGGIGGIGVLLGYMPMHFGGALLSRFTKKNVTAAIAMNIIGWLAAVAYSWLWIVMWPGMGWLIAAAALVGMPAGLYNWFDKVKQSPLVRGALKKAADADSGWDEEKLIAYTKDIFIKYQQHWSTFDVEAMKAYMTPYYHYHASLLMYVLQTMGRKDIMENVVIKNVQIVDIQDSVNNEEDYYTVGITASAHDQLVEASDSSKIFTDNSTFTEFWTFRRSGKTWLLDVITQATANPYAANNALQLLAQQYNYCYSEDMGWLFIPRRGQLFGGAKFGTSDINNHIVGMYQNKLLVQLYSYVKDPQNNSKVYVIAQINVPRQYGNIIVRRSKLLQLPITNLKRVQTEWTQFNKKYEVFASSEEQATSFELLNPTYMEQLEALPFEVNIEVVDNVIYLYTNERGTTIETYGVMLDLINKAFQELRL